MYEQKQMALWVRQWDAGNSIYIIQICLSLSSPCFQLPFILNAEPWWRCWRCAIVENQVDSLIIQSRQWVDGNIYSDKTALWWLLLCKTLAPCPSSIVSDLLSLCVIKLACSHFPYLFQGFASKVRHFAEVFFSCKEPRRTQSKGGCNFYCLHMTAAIYQSRLLGSVFFFFF